MKAQHSISVAATIVCVLGLPIGHLARADDRVLTDEEIEASKWQEMSFLILKSTPDYAEAKRFAAVAALRLQVRLNLRGLSKHKKTGLTFERTVCEDEFGEYPCYWPRGREEGGAWISVEHSARYQGFKPGLYIVILQHARSDEPDIHATLQRAKKFFPSVYIKRTKVYQGCIH